MTLFETRIDAASGHARAMTFETAHGPVHTPMFMPVGTRASVCTMELVSIVENICEVNPRMFALFSPYLKKLKPKEGEEV